MTRGFNKIILIGNVTKDPDIRYTANQTPVASFALAVNRTWRSTNGENHDEVTYINIVVWGKLAELCERYVKKGMALFVEGRLSIRSYNAKTGEKRYATEVIAENLQFIGSPRREDTSDGENAAGGVSYNNRYQSMSSVNNNSMRSYRDIQQPTDNSFGASEDFNISQNDSFGNSNEFSVDINELGPSAGSINGTAGDEGDIPF